MFAYIPARGGSKRIPRKNIRPLNGKPVIARVIESLRPLEFLSAIYVSTDDPEIAEVAQASGAKYLKARAPELSNDKAGFMDLIRDDLPHFMKARRRRRGSFVRAADRGVGADRYLSAGP